MEKDKKAVMIITPWICSVMALPLRLSRLSPVLLLSVVSWMSPSQSWVEWMRAQA